MQIKPYYGLLILVFTLVSLFQDKIYCQDLIIGGGTTLSTYFGDLAPYNLKQSWAEVHPGIGIYASKRIFKKIYFEVDAEQSTISAHDKNGASDDRKGRNLSFRSPISSLSASLCMRLGLLKYNKLGIYAGASASIFKFDPQAKLEGRWYRLRPLGTEGQGLPGGPKKYSLLQTAIPLQLGLYYRLKPRLFIELEVTQYFTNTDYLDDVSGVNIHGDYFDLERLRKEKGDLAFRFADRSLEVNPGGIPYSRQGIKRGNPLKNDQFLFFKVGIAYSIKSKMHKQVYRRAIRIKCPELSKDWFVNTSGHGRNWQ